VKNQVMSRTSQHKEKTEDTLKSGALKKYGICIALGVLLVVTVAAFFASLSNSWTYYDDQKLVLENALIRDLSWENIKVMFTTTEHGDYLIPLVHLSFGLDWALWKEEAFGYHLTNLIFHIINSMLVFGLIMKLSNRNVLASFVASTLFAIHPLHVESVAWIAGRRDQVVAFFFIQSVIYYLFFIENRRWYFYALAFVAFIAALLSKPMAVTLPLVFLLCDWRRDGKLRLRHVLSKVPLFAISGFFAVLTVFFHREIIRPFGLTSVLVACRGYLAYLSKTILPIHLSALYPYPLKASPASPAYFLSPIILAGLLFFLLKIRKKHRDVFFHFLFFFIVLLPVVQLVPQAIHFIADRFHYIPSIGLFGLAGIGYAKLLRLSRGNKFLSSTLIALLTVLIAVFSYLTFKRCAVWRGPLSVWRDVTRNYPDYYRGHNNLGEEYLKLAGTEMDENKSRLYLQKAMGEYQKSLELAPLNYVGLVGLGRVYRQMKDYKKAEELIKAALKVKPDYALGLMHLGMVHKEQQRYAEAVKELSAAIELDSGDFRYFIVRGSCYDKLGEYVGAVEDFKRALGINPRLELALFKMGCAYIELKDYEKAEQAFRSVIELKKSYVVDAYLNLAYVYQKMGRFQEAIRLCDMLIEGDVSPIIAYERLGGIFAEMKKYRKAREAFKKALELSPPPPRRKIIEEALEKIRDK